VPSASTIDVAHKVVLTRAWGVLVEEEFLAHARPGIPGAGIGRPGAMLIPAALRVHRMLDTLHVQWHAVVPTS
jgi:hypothetical protein